MENGLTPNSIALDGIVKHDAALSYRVYIPVGQSPTVQLVCEGKEFQMILLQICLLPFSVLLLLGAIFVIGSAGIEQPESSTRIVQDVAFFDEPNSIWTTDSICLSYQSHSSKETGLEQVNLIQTEINQSNPPFESLSKLPIYKLSR